MKLSKDDKKLLITAIAEAKGFLDNHSKTVTHPKDLNLIREQVLKYDAIAERFYQSLSMGHAKKEVDPNPDSCEPDWKGHCDLCGQTPIVPVTGMCGPCTFGKADTSDGNW